MATKNQKEKPSIDMSYPVQVYRNLHNGLLSVRQRGVVVAHMEEVHLHGVSFHIQPAGQARCRKNKQKTVHAYVRGYLTDAHREHEQDTVHYDPYKNDTFVLSNGETITHLRKLSIYSEGKMIVREFLESFQKKLQLEQQKGEPLSKDEIRMMLKFRQNL